MRDAEAMSDMYRAIDRCPKPVIARVHGAALGGGAGLCAVADAVVAAEETVFGFTETKLGIIPAVISPFVLAKIGVSHARRLFLTGERFDARRAQAIGLVHEVVHEDALDGTVDAIAERDRERRAERGRRGEGADPRRRARRRTTDRARSPRARSPRQRTTRRRPGRAARVPRAARRRAGPRDDPPRC